jgi:His-Xaa-Ser system protein HxsD
VTDGAPASEEVTLAYDLDTRSVAFTIDEDVYSRDTVYGAAHLFVDRAWLFLSRPADRMVRVRLKTKTERPTEGELEALAGEFANELLNQAVRQQVGEATRSIREYYMARAFFGTPETSTIDRLLAELDAEELAEDDLEIRVPWATSSESPDPGDGTEPTP